MQNVNDVPPMPDEEPIPLIREVQIPAFPVDSFPEPIADQVRGVAEATQTDPAMAGTSALSVLSACTGGRAVIEIRSGWREPLNLYTTAIALPGERKSAVQSTMVQPLLDAERDLIEKARPAHEEASTLKQIAMKNAERLCNAAAKEGAGNDEKAEAISAVQEANEITVIPLPRLVADDATPEAATSLLAEQGGRIAVISAEGGIFDIVAGRYSGNVPNMDIWLKGHSGDEIRVDRKGRDPEWIPNPAITLGLMIQPDVLRTIAERPAFRGRGFLARFLYSWPQSNVGNRKISPTPVGEMVIKKYNKVVSDLTTAMAGKTGEPVVLHLTGKAHDAIIAIETAVEPTLGDDGELATLRDWGSKYVGAIARIAGILHLAEHGVADGICIPVSAETILAAARIGAYFKASAIKVFAQMGIDPDTADAVYLLGRIHSLGVDEVSERDVQRVGKRFRSKDELKPVIARLVNHGYLIPVDTPKQTGGRPQSQRYRIHPSR
jgi:replicative DNA helicase